MKNFKVTAKEDNKEYWISRACAVVVCIVSNNNIPKLLISQRGSGCPDNIDKWQFTCGYLDWDETLQEGAQRELFEELGLKIPLDKFELFEISSEPKDDTRQNIVFRYKVVLEEEELVRLFTEEVNKNSESRGGECNEVSCIDLISPDKIDSLDWAFNHKELAKRLVKSCQ